ncbi:phosphotriesterase-related protein [Bacillus sp. OV166]|uniref:phosphotriesterase family protein n=1 Tax=Bacillus sp. OV166 TaxID=1882763 RepID=UPI000A2AE903|nr:phosphotriesterase [Bacillus sp. OV166]SMQ72137.1 phosphotriesterase-related protein [Bacillus sp. OV166]
MMGKVNTVLGPVATEDLGITAMHEHIGFGLPGCDLDTQWWKKPEEAFEVTIQKLRRFREHGGKTFVDCTGIGNGRDIEYFQVLSRRTGVHIVAVTGFVAGDSALPYFRNKSVEYLTDLFVHEITVGIDGTGAKAGALKVGVSRGGQLSELDKRIYRAAARAAVKTGAPIITHLSTDPMTALEIFEEEGLPLDRVLMGHADVGQDADDERDALIASRGGYVGFDTIGYDTEMENAPYWSRPRQDRVDHFLRFLDKGFLDRAVISADANCCALGWPGLKGHSVNYLFEEFIPDLRKAGVGEEVFEQLLLHTPANFLTLQEPR